MPLAIELDIEPVPVIWVVDDISPPLFCEVIRKWLCSSRSEAVKGKPPLCDSP